MEATRDRQRLRLRTDEFDRLAGSLLGESTQSAIAERLGTHPTTLSQYRHGTRFVSVAFVAACKAEMPSVPMDTLFEVVSERQPV